MDGDPGNGAAADGRLYCYRCGHFWKARSDALPRTCPRCGSSRWNYPVSSRAVCRFCGNTWRMGSVTDPCPECGHTIFESPDTQVCHCIKCDYEWRPRTSERPERCPMCRSTLWDAPRSRRYACRVCGHVWVGGEDAPERCPRCRSTAWSRPAIRVQCRVCGHIWVLRGGRTTDSVKRCPSCRSSRWMEPPAMARCPVCGLSYIPSTGSRRCPACSGDPSVAQRSCGFCGMEWSSGEDAPKACPRCGRSTVNGKDSFLDLWREGDAILRYALTDGIATVYLWIGGVPVSARYFHDVCAFLGVTSQGFSDRLNEGTLDLSEVAKRMSEHRNSFQELEGYFQRRLGLCPDDETVLLLHFTGMCPEAIALHLSRPLKDIRSAFDRIMTAYEDSGIVVDDTVFTEDPVRLYRYHRRERAQPMAAFFAERFGGPSERHQIID